MKKKILLTILDGWGIAETWGGNAVALANTPCMDYLSSEYPYTLLGASGETVGLPFNEPGNSEVGHQNIGSGQIVKQDLSAINEMIADKSFFSNPALKGIFGHVKETDTSLHLVGLLSNGGIHSHIKHLFALLEMARNEGLKKVNIHIITDGRDTPPTQGLSFTTKLEEVITQYGVGKIVSVSGRYFAMDRDSHWDRIEKFYNVLTGEAKTQQCPAQNLFEKSYAEGITDEFIEPVLLSSDGKIKNEDSVIFFNYRSDRMRQIVRAITQKTFSEFKRNVTPKNLLIGTFSSYQEGTDAKVLFNLSNIINPLASILSKNKLRHLHAAETEKYAHVTYFFNGGVEKPFEGEERILVPSPSVKTYDLKPEMSAQQITNKLLHKLSSNHFDFTVLNFANADMVGHTGNMEATIKAVETADRNLGQLIKNLSDDYIFMVTADHGNAEQMVNPVTALPDTEHTINPVPFILAHKSTKGKELKEGGRLCDIVPSVLDLLDINKPATTNGQSLFK